VIEVHIVVGFEFAHPSSINIEADHERTRPAERHGHGETYTASPTTAIFRNATSRSSYRKLGDLQSWIGCVSQWVACKI
jgi:hypothetical protein